jgi:Family of unknown function (DUF6496)
MKSGAKPGKIKTVMKEWKEGKLKSGKSDKKVTNPKQAIAIALSEAGMSKNKKRGGGAIMASKKSTMGEALSKGGMKRAEGGSTDVTQDKALIKKAIKMHDAQEHKGEHTDLSHLKKGGEESKMHEAKESKKEEMMEHGKRGGGAIMASKKSTMGEALAEGGEAESDKESKESKSVVSDKEMAHIKAMQNKRGGGAIMASKRSTMGEALSKGGEVKGTGVAIRGFRPAKMS